MDYFVVYFCIIIYLGVGTCIPSSMLEGKMVSGFFFVFIVIVLSLVDNELFLMNYQRHQCYLGSSFPLISSSAKNFIFLKSFFFLNLFLLILVDLKETPPRKVRSEEKFGKV